MSDFEFQRMLYKLCANLRTLDEHFERLSRERLEREINIANSFLSQLWEKMKREQIEASKFASTLIDAEQRLESLKLKLETKSSSGFWGRFLGFIERAINFVASLFGLGSLLPNFSGVRLLPYSDK